MRGEETVFQIILTIQWVAPGTPKRVPSPRPAGRRLATYHVVRLKGLPYESFRLKELSGPQATIPIGIDWLAPAVADR
jgi:hypothetical protein